MTKATSTRGSRRRELTLNRKDLTMGNMNTAVANLQPLTRDEWLRERRKGIGASDVAAALGLDRYKSPLTLWAEKRGELPERKETFPMRMGKMMEPVLHQFYEEETGRKLVDPGEYMIVVHPDFEWFRCTPDRLHVSDDHWHGAPCEMKALGETTGKDFKDGGAGKLEYQIQLQAQIAILQHDRGSLAAAVGNREFFPVDFDRHDAIIDKMIPALKYFMDCVVSGKQPDIDHLASTTATLKALHPKDNGATVIADETAIDWIRRFEAAKEQAKALEDEEALAKNNLIAILGDATYLEFDDGRYSYKHQARKGSLKVETEYAFALRRSAIPFKETPESEFRVLRKHKT